MKKKIIISLILAMCCIMASIPASAVDEVAPTAITCKVHSSYYLACDYAMNVTTETHEVTLSTGGIIICEYTNYDARTYICCGVCQYIVQDNRFHSHGDLGHTTNLCGWENDYDGVYCEIANH